MVRLSEHFEELCETERHIRASKTPDGPHYRDLCRHYETLRRDMETALKYIEEARCEKLRTMPRE